MSAVLLDGRLALVALWSLPPPEASDDDEASDSDDSDDDDDEDGDASSFSADEMST